MSAVGYISGRHSDADNISAENCGLRVEKVGTLVLLVRFHVAIVLFISVIVVLLVFMSTNVALKLSNFGCMSLTMQAVVTLSSWNYEF